MRGGVRNGLRLIGQSVRHGAIGTPSWGLGSLEGNAVIRVVCISTRRTGIQRLGGLCT